MASGISLANKCQLLFGFAVVVILTVALRSSSPSVSMYTKLSSPSKRCSIVVICQEKRIAFQIRVRARSE